MEKVKKNDNLWLAVIAGGQGTRLFPISNDSRPKQFCECPSTGGLTFIQATVSRFHDLGVNLNHVVVIVTNDNQRALAKEMLLPMGVISPNIVKIAPTYGYSGSMAYAAEFISELDEESTIINTPSDQFIMADEKFNDTMRRAIASANDGFATIVGVKVNDVVTATGCGHAEYDPDEDGDVVTVRGFIEKPERELAVKMLREGSTACNTGINVWKAKTILKAVKNIKLGEEELATDTLMDLLGRKKLAVGNFKWFDCGTLASLYQISPKTPNHKNACLGEGKFERYGCKRSFFYAPKDVTIIATDIVDSAVVANIIDDKPVVVGMKLEESQQVRKLAEDYKNNKDLLLGELSIRARNNRVPRTPFSSEVSVGFIGWQFHAVLTYKDPNTGHITIYVSRDAEEIQEEALA